MNLFETMAELRALPWFPLCVRDIRSFRMDHWSDFTPWVLGSATDHTL